MYLSVRNRPGGGTATRARATQVGGTVVLLGMVSLFTDVSSEMVSAVLPLYLTAELGMSVLAYGFVDGLYQGVSALVRIAGGYLGDRHNRPKWVAAAGYGVSALSRLAMLPVHGLATLTSVITADRLGKGLRTAPRDALIADASDPLSVGRAFGVHRTLDTIGAAIGPLAAFALLYSMPGGYDSIFVASFAFAVVGLAFLVLFVPDRRVQATPGEPVSVRRVLAQITAPKVRAPLLAAALLGVCTVGDGFLYLSLQQRDSFAAVYFPLLYVGTNIAYLSLAVPFGRLADRVGRSRVFLGGHVALLVAYLSAAGPFPGVAATLVTLALLGAFYAATDGVLAALVSGIVAPSVRGTGIAAAQTVVAVARFASSLAFGGIWLALGRAHALLLVAGLLAGAMLFAAWVLRGSRRAGDAGGPAPAEGERVATS